MDFSGLLKDFVKISKVLILLTCIQTSCYASWTEWASSSCDQPCGNGIRFKIRQCRYYGADFSEECVGSAMKVDYCFEKECPLYEGSDCFDINDPNGYRGTINVTRNGKNCFDWDHEFSGYRPVNFPSSGLEKNYCRNPNGVNKRPWCYSNKKRNRANFCSVPICPTAQGSVKLSQPTQPYLIEVYWNDWSAWSSCSVSCDSGVTYRVRSCNGGKVTQGGCQGDVVEYQQCKITLCQKTTSSPVRNCAILGNTSTYRGNISRTIYGVECQRWNTQTPNQHTFYPSRFPEADLSENHCRNPDGDKWPWCITTGEQQWNYCDVPECETDSSEKPPEVGCYEENAAEDYRGSASVTQSGHMCQYWDSNTPNSHQFKSFMHPGKGLGHHNHCRAPDNDTIPWCITTKAGSLWEYCNVSVCGEHEDASFTWSASTSSSGDCGRPSVAIRVESPSYSMGQRIVGGMSVNKGSIPWQVALLVTKTRKQICGASILHKDWIMTAAHCVTLRPNPSSYMGVAGRHWRKGGGKEEVELQFQRIFVHEFYDNMTFINDIALIKLNKSINFNNFIKPICLPEPFNGKQIESTEHLLVTGWGRIATDGYVYSKTLQQVYLPLVSQQECEASYPNQIYDGMICAGFVQEGGKDSCLGDSGGPLVRLSSYQQIGIVSWGHSCAMPNYPGVYTYVPYYVNWIQSIMTQH